MQYKEKYHIEQIKNKNKKKEKKKKLFFFI